MVNEDLSFEDIAKAVSLWKPRVVEEDKNEAKELEAPELDIDPDFEFLSDMSNVTDMNEYVDRMLKNIKDKELYVSA